MKTPRKISYQNDVSRGICRPPHSVNGGVNGGIGNFPSPSDVSRPEKSANEADLIALEMAAIIAELEGES